MTSKELKDIEAICNKIDTELSAVRKAFDNIDESVNNDIDSIVSSFLDKIDDPAISNNIKKRHFADLKNKKIEALNRAKERLQNLKKEICSIKSVYATEPY